MSAARVPLRIAHAYGNSRESLQRALDAPIDIIELDIWLSGGRIYVRHDRRLDPLPILVDRRMRGHARAPFSVRLCKGYYIRPDFGVMKLGEVLDSVRGKRRLLLDAKGDYGAQQTSAFAGAIAEEITEYDANDWASVCGQFWPVMDRLREIAPDLEVRYSIERAFQWQKFQRILDEPGLVPGVCIEHRFLNEERARFIKEHGISVYCWTVDDPVEAARLVAGGVDGIISNDLELLAKLGLKTSG